MLIEQKHNPIFIQIYEQLLEVLKPSGWWPAQTPLEVIIGAVLTQNTAWTNIEKALHNLRTAQILHDGYKILQLPDTELATLIKPAGFFNLKTKRLKAVLHFFATSCGFSFNKLSPVPLSKLREKLLAVHGVGAETADSILLYALHKQTFVVDTYTRRLLGRHNLIDHNATYEDIRILFLQNLPKDTQLFNEYHALIVRTCKLWCHKKVPNCTQCPINNLC